MTVPSDEAPAHARAAARVEVTSADRIATRGGYYADDLLAIQAGSRPDGLFYLGPASAPGHRAVRSASIALSVCLREAGGLEAWGDVVTPQYSGFSGRDVPIDPAAHGPQVDAAVEVLRAAGKITFQEGCALLENCEFGGRRLHTGVRYGLSQALIGLIAQREGSIPARLLADEFGTEDLKSVPIYAQVGEDRYRGVDKTIMKRVDVLPHGLINSRELFGDEGQSFLEYAGWVRERVLRFGDTTYRPVIHLDVYGLPGLTMGASVERMVALCARLVAVCAPLSVQLESPVYGRSADETQDRLAELRHRLRDRGIPVKLVADDWCNTLDDIRSFVTTGSVDMVQIKMPDLGCLTNALEAAAICRDNEVAIFVGGSCTETDVSARYSAHVALAVSADQVLAKPGMGVDEGTLIVGNEMDRVLKRTR